MQSPISRSSTAGTAGSGSSSSTTSSAFSAILKRNPQIVSDRYVKEAKLKAYLAKKYGNGACEVHVRVQAPQKSPAGVA
jgi:hypothetical protein